MGKPTGFIEYDRKNVTYRPLDQRVKDYDEVAVPHTQEELVQQAARCMDCGIPFCHAAGCPLGNLIPEFNDLVYADKWQEACQVLHSTNNFPEFTGRVCPAPCEAACTLNMNDDPVLICHIEYQIVERGFAEGWVKPMPARIQTGKRIAVVGSGPAGLAAAQQLTRAGHGVVVFEKSDKIGGLLRYGIPDFKLQKQSIDRRMEQMSAEGVQFQTSVDVGVDVSAKYLRQQFDAICLTMGAGVARDLPVEGRELEGIHFAMDYLAQQNAANSGLQIPASQRINAKDDVVVVIGGGDTGSDCVGTARRQGAKEVHQFEILPKPPEDCNPETPWPDWPRILRTSSSHKEGCQRRWCVMTKRFSGREGKLEQLHGVEVEWTSEDGHWKMAEVAGTEFSVKTGLVLLAMGFVHVEHSGIVTSLDLKRDPRGNIMTDSNCQTSQADVFCAGDAASGASLVVRAVKSGRNAAAAIDRWLRQQ